MTDHEINEKLRQAYTHAAPDVLDAVLSDCREQKGSVTVMTMNKKNNPWAKRLAGMAACLCLILGGALGLQNYRVNNTVDTTVSLDVNPSVEIQVNRKERVLEVIPLNEDGKVIVGDMDFSGSNLEVTVNALIGSMLQNGYLNELANSILISVDNDDPVRSAELQERLAAEVNKLLQTDTFSGAVLSQTVSKDKELQQLSAEYGITAGKAQLIQEILGENPLHTFEELASLSINELNLLRAGQTTATKVEAVGTASDKAYIGEAKAKEIALGKAGVSAKDLTAYEIEMDTHKGVMIYDVEFNAGGYEYECEINASTGAVLKFEKEADDDAVPAQAAQPESMKSSGNVPGTFIGEAKAKEIALKHAGATAGEISAFKSKLDTDDGIAVYELEFRAGGYEYDYEINASTGEILQSEKDRNGDAPSHTEQTAGSNPSAASISETRAKEIALQHAGIAVGDISSYKSELDTDDGAAVYKVEFKANGYEYEYKISASAGEILKAEKDRDD